MSSMPAFVSQNNQANKGIARNHNSHQAIPACTFLPSNAQALLASDQAMSPTGVDSSSVAVRSVAHVPVDSHVHVLSDATIAADATVAATAPAHAYIHAFFVAHVPVDSHVHIVSDAPVAAIAPAHAYVHTFFVVHVPVDSHAHTASHTDTTSASCISLEA